MFDSFIMEGKIKFVPAGGLANRMRAMASMVALAGEVQKELEVVWFRDWALHAPFKGLFEPCVIPFVQIKEARLMDLFLSDRPRKRNFWFPKYYQQWYFRHCLYEHQIDALRKGNFDFVKWASTSKRVYMASYLPFYPYPQSLMHNLFRPVPEILQEISRRCAEFASYTVGVHVRRTDNVLSIAQSPLQLFYKSLDKELETHSEMRIYLATDSEEVKSQMRNRYGELLICADRQANRNTLSGIRDGIADMYTLSHTQKIYGSYYSSFSELAAELGHIPLEVMRKE